MIALWLTTLIVSAGISPPPNVPLDPIYSAAWMPVIKVDRDGRRVKEKPTLDDLAEASERAIPAELRASLTPTIERVERFEPDLIDLAAFDQLLADIRAISDALPPIQMALIEEWSAIAAEMQARADDERDVEFLLLFS